MATPNHRIVWDTFAIRNTRTKTDILTERAEYLRRELASVENYLDGLALTPCNLTCDGCGTVLNTEADFASHFIVTDETYLNLGECPNGKRV